MKKIIGLLASICGLGFSFASIDQNLPSNPQFLTIPLSSTTKYSIPEGWIYSSGENAIHGLVYHKSVDYAADYGTPVYAPVDGWAQASYYNTTLGTSGERKMYQGQTINYGLGWWVQIIFPDQAEPKNPSKVYFVQLAHLSKFSPKLQNTIKNASFVYDSNEDALKIDNYSIPYTGVAKILSGRGYGKFVKVKKGELLGYVGTTGLEKGTLIGTGFVPVQYDKDPKNSWDEPHLHFQIFTRNQKGGKMPSGVLDMYNLGTGATEDMYPTHSNGKILTGGNHFVTTDGLLPDFAK